jgi:hypothetical protein
MRRDSDVDQGMVVEGGGTGLMVAGDGRRGEVP